MKKLLLVVVALMAQALCFGQGGAVVTFTGRRDGRSSFF